MIVEDLGFDQATDGGVTDAGVVGCLRQAEEFGVWRGAPLTGNLVSGSDRAHAGGVPALARGGAALEPGQHPGDLVVAVALGKAAEDVQILLGRGV